MPRRVDVCSARRSGRCWSAGPGARRAPRPWRCAAGSCWRPPKGEQSKEIAERARLHDADGGPLARALRRAGPRRPPRRAAAGPAAQDHRRRRRAGDHEDAGGEPAGRHPLVDPLDGGGDRAEPDRGQPDLARLRAKAPPLGALQALARPAVHRQGQGHRRALPQPAGGRGRPLRRREVPDPGARALRADPAADARRPRAPDPRLRPQRHHQPLRRPRHRLREGDRRDDPPPPRRGVPQVPEPDRALGARGPRASTSCSTTPRPTRRRRSSAG